MPKMRQLIAAATVLAGITFAGTARANEITNIASAAEEITLTSGQITVGNPGTVHLPETATTPSTGTWRMAASRWQLATPSTHTTTCPTRIKTGLG